MKSVYNREFRDETTLAWFIVARIGLVLFIGAIIAFYLFEDKIITGQPTCIMYKILHLYCMGCGGTRSFNFFIRGHLIKSFLYNPFVPYTIIVYISFYINTLLVTKTKKAGFTGFPITILAIGGVVLLFVQCIIRNILFVKFGITCL